MKIMVVLVAIKSYQRKKKTVGYKRALTFRYNYMAILWNRMENLGERSMYGCYIVATTSICFCLWLRIDVLVNVKISDLSLDN